MTHDELDKLRDILREVTGLMEDFEKRITALEAFQHTHAPSGE